MVTINPVSGLPRKQRKRSPAPTPRPKMAAYWADPEWKAKTVAKLQEAAARSRAENPEKNFRRGIPDGMRKSEAQDLWAQAREKAQRFITTMEDLGELPELVVPGSEEEMAKRALEEAFTLAVSPLSNAQTKNQAIRTILEWTKAKPESKSKLTLNSSEEWLDALVSDNKKPDGR